MKVRKNSMKFLDMWTGRKKSGLDYSRKLEKQYVEIPPYARDDKGKFINDSARPILKEIDSLDVDAYIQSFKEDTDIYKILEKAYYANDVNYLQKKAGGFYGDVSDLPADPFAMEELNKNIVEAMVSGAVKDSNNIESTEENNEVNNENVEVKENA